MTVLHTLYRGIGLQMGKAGQQGPHPSARGAAHLMKQRRIIPLQTPTYGQAPSPAPREQRTWIPEETSRSTDICL